MIHKQRFIAVMVESSTSWGRDIIRGIRRYAQEGCDWVLYMQPWGFYDQLRLPRKWSGDGIIARVTNNALLSDILKTGCPAINVSSNAIHKPGRVLQCTVNQRSVAKLAVEHFLERGYRNLAHCSHWVVRPQEENLMWRSFAEYAAQAGLTALQYCPLADGRKTINRDTADLERLGRWLKQQPKPLAVLASNSAEARNIASTCRRMHITVPEEVAILSSDHDDLICETSTPPLSSIDPQSRQVGYHAARMLDAMLRDEKPDSPYLIEPTSISVRQSTDSMAVENSELALALSYLRKNASKPINIGAVLKHVPISRRSLEQACLKLLGRTPAAELRRIRLKKVVQLLEETEMSIEQIARRSGFESPDILLRNFRREYGISPSIYRKQARKNLV